MLPFLSAPFAVPPFAAPGLSTAEPHPSLFVPIVLLDFVVSVIHVSCYDGFQSFLRNVGKYTWILSPLGKKIVPEDQEICLCESKDI